MIEIEGIYVCPYCFTQMEADDAYCRECGNSGDMREASTLPLHTVLAGRYMTGQTFHRSASVVAYYGLDLENAARVQIEEYFPDECSLRNSPETDIHPRSTSKAAGAFERGKALFSARAKAVCGAGLFGSLDAVEENNTAYFISELPLGICLAERLSLFGPIAADGARAIARPLCESLEAVFSLGLIHGDIRPENILLEGEGRARLTGFAQSANPEVFAARGLAEARSDPYLPTEAFADGGSLSEASDIYSLGASLYAALHGSGPPPAVARLMGTGADAGGEGAGWLSAAIDGMIKPLPQERSLPDFGSEADFSPKEGPPGSGGAALPPEQQSASEESESHDGSQEESSEMPLENDNGIILDWGAVGRREAANEGLSIEWGPTITQEEDKPMEDSSDAFRPFPGFEGKGGQSRVEAVRFSDPFFGDSEAVAYEDDESFLADWEAGGAVVAATASGQTAASLAVREIGNEKSGGEVKRAAKSRRGAGYWAFMLSIVAICILALALVFYPFEVQARPVSLAFGGIEMTGLYSGGWRFFKPNGLGAMSIEQANRLLAAGSTITATFVGGIPRGEGVIKAPNGDVLEGVFSAGLLEGAGKIRKANGDVYTGTFVAGLLQGKGMAVTADAVYTGDFTDSQITGTGQYVFSGSGGERYEGGVKDGARDGHGVYIYADGSYFEGEYESDIMNGPGAFYDANGEVILEGVWKDGIYQGEES